MAVHVDEKQEICPFHSFAVGQIVDVDQTLSKLKGHDDLIEHVVVAVGMREGDGSKVPKDKDIRLLLAPTAMLRSEEALHEDYTFVFNYDEHHRKRNEIGCKQLLHFKFAFIREDSMEFVFRLLHIFIQRER